MIQAYYQQERVKNSTARAAEKTDTTDKNESKDGTSESNTDAETISIDSAKAGGSANEVVAVADDVSTDVEMTDISAGVQPSIKTEPEDDSSVNENVDAIATNKEDSVDRMDVDGDRSETEIKSETEEIDGDDDSNADDSNKREQQSANNNEDGTTSVDDQSIKVEEASTSEDTDDPYAKDIDIDPRTYCKLGHFHLLLEDYPRGKFRALIGSQTKAVRSEKIHESISGSNGILSS